MVETKSVGIPINLSSQAGFTLIELLVAMVIGTIVVTALLQLISGQGRFLERQSVREEIQQNSRAALEQIGSELRGLPPGGGLVRASEDSITFRVPRIWGVVCDVVGSDRIDLVVPGLAGVSLAPNSATGLVIDLGTSLTPGWSNAVGVSSVSGPFDECAGQALGMGAERRSLFVTSIPVDGERMPIAGDLAYLFEQVTYRSGRSASAPGLWIQRRVGDGPGSSNQPMAGPIHENGEGLRFAYLVDSDGPTLPTPIQEAAVRESVNRIIVYLETVGRHSGFDRATRADTMVLSLRNRTTL